MERVNRRGWIGLVKLKYSIHKGKGQNKQGGVIDEQKWQETREWMHEFWEIDKLKN